MFIEEDDEWAWYKRQSDETHDFSNVTIVGQDAHVNGVYAYTTSDDAWVLIDKSELLQLAQKQQQLDECLLQLKQLQDKYQKSSNAYEARMAKHRKRVAAVLRRYLDGMSVKEIVEDTNIKKSSCYKIIKYFKNLDEKDQQIVIQIARSGVYDEQ